MDLSRLKAEFIKSYPTAGKPFICRIPGRVNLMGEHLDYNGLPVLPMAIDRAIYLAFAPTTEGTIRLKNMDATYPEVVFQNEAHVVPSPSGAWENYAKAAIEALNQHFSVEEFPGMEMLIVSDLPHSAGLSSSSALVVGAGMAYLAALGYTLDQDLSRLAFAGLLANAEHYVGTAGGGMDQTAILLGEEGCATRITFIPFQVEAVPLPDNISILLCDSLVEVQKSGDALRTYNEGPASCSLMTALINAHLREDFGEEFSIECLGELWLGALCFNRAEVTALLDVVFPEPYLQPETIASRLGMSQELVQEYWLSAIDVGNTGLPLQARARHVLTEYYRVEAGRDALLAGDPGLFGALMNESHRSCAEDYGISTPELDTLCQILNDAGCYGARLTGAGFGGSVVAMVESDIASHAARSVKEQYYDTRVSGDGSDPYFYVHPSDGARHIS